MAAQVGGADRRRPLIARPCSERGEMASGTCGLDAEARTPKELPKCGVH